MAQQDDTIWVYALRSSSAEPNGQLADIWRRF